MTYPMPGCDWPDGRVDTVRLTHCVEENMRRTLESYIGRVSSPAAIEDIRLSLEHSFEGLPVSDINVSAGADNMMYVHFGLNQPAQFINMTVKLVSDNATDWPTGDNRIHVEL